MLTTVHRKHEYVMIHQPEIRGVRETPQYCPPDPSSHQWEREWIL